MGANFREEYRLICGNWTQVSEQRAHKKTGSF